MIYYAQSIEQQLTVSWSNVLNRLTHQVAAAIGFVGKQNSSLCNDMPAIESLVCFCGWERQWLLHVYTFHVENVTGQGCAFEFAS